MSQAQQKTAFNVIMEGTGYLNRVRMVEVRKGPAYLACSIGALMGLADEVEYLSLDCRVVGVQAKEVVELLKSDVIDRKKVIIGFRAADPRPDIYEYTKKGTNEIVKVEGLKARLLQITFAKVDGTRISIPVVERPNAERSDAPAQHHDDGGSACEDATLVEAHA